MKLLITQEKPKLEAIWGACFPVQAMKLSYAASPGRAAPWT